MTLKELLTGKFNRNTLDKKVFSLLSTLIVIVGLLIVIGILFPVMVALILNTLWIVLVTLVVIFFVLGLLVILGMRKEVGRVLDAFLEGSLRIIDFLDLLRDLWRQFVELVKEFLIFAAPFFAYVAALLIYVILLLIYKSIGKDHDVTYLTIILTFVSLVIFGIVSKPRVDTGDEKWSKKFGKRFRAGLIDGFEVVLFIFFLTMDSTKIFFLSPDLNVPLHAKMGDFDFMVKSIDYKGYTRITLNLIIATIIIEIVRNILRIFALSRMYYLEYLATPISEENKSLMAIIKNSIRKSFDDSKDDVMKFITLNTVLFAVFLFFPRLKLLALTVSSATNLLLDLFIRTRLTTKKNTDLISRTITKVFNL
jgi:hypothetical protein